jgi:hypothetical protein
MIAKEGAPVAKVLERPESLYDQDVIAWLEKQVAYLRAGRPDALDAVHLIEELEAMVGSRRRELKSRLRVLLMHLLNWDHQPRRRSRSWASTIEEQRAQIQDLLEESPSLRHELDATARAAELRSSPVHHMGTSRRNYPTIRVAFWATTRGRVEAWRLAQSPAVLAQRRVPATKGHPRCRSISTPPAPGCRAWCTVPTPAKRL